MKVSSFFSHLTGFLYSVVTRIVKHRLPVNGRQFKTFFASQYIFPVIPTFHNIGSEMGVNKYTVDMNDVKRFPTAYPPGQFGG